MQKKTGMDRDKKVAVKKFCGMRVTTCALKGTEWHRKFLSEVRISILQKTYLHFYK
jgi:hypothetical protein